MLLIKIENGQPSGFPILESNFRLYFADRVFPQTLTTSDVWDLGFAIFNEVERPVELAGNKIVEGSYILETDNTVSQSWEYTPLTAEEIAELEAEALRIAAVEKVNNRYTQLAASTVTSTQGNIFDADELAQNRMSRAIISMDDVETIEWILNNNSVALVTKAELVEVLKLAGINQTNIWVSTI
jgi:hypothetical protein